MIPRGLEEEHFLRAADRIDKEGVPSARKAYHYDVILRGEPYPPKYVISLANIFATGSEHPAGRFNAVEARDYFRSRGYVVNDRRSKSAPSIVVEDDESAFPEGKERYRLHRSLERDATIARKAKIKRLVATGRLHCDVCSLGFEDIYGARGEGFIEAHHTVSSGDIARECKDEGFGYRARLLELSPNAASRNSFVVGKRTPRNR